MQADWKKTFERYTIKRSVDAESDILGLEERRKSSNFVWPISLNYGRCFALIESSTGYESALVSFYQICITLFVLRIPYAR